MKGFFPPPFFVCFSLFEFKLGATSMSCLPIGLFTRPELKVDRMLNFVLMRSAFCRGVEEGQFINSKSLHIVPPLVPRRFGSLNRESESSGSQPVYRKLFPRGPHSSKNNFFEIKISRSTSLDSLSVLLWLLFFPKPLES